MKRWDDYHAKNSRCNRCYQLFTRHSVIRPLKNTKLISTTENLLIAYISVKLRKEGMLDSCAWSTRRHSYDKNCSYNGFTNLCQITCSQQATNNKIKPAPCITIHAHWSRTFPISWARLYMHLQLNCVHNTETAFLIFSCEHWNTYIAHYCLVHELIKQMDNLCVSFRWIFDVRKPDHCL